jgi:pentatricopeptide repeat protein
VDFIQMIISGIMTIVGASSILFIAVRCYTIGSDVAEMKELLREMKRSGMQRGEIDAPLPIPGLDTEPGNWPSVTDPRYNANSNDVPFALRVADDPSQELKRHSR